jgi:hypothetical protein
VPSRLDCRTTTLLTRNTTGEHAIRDRTSSNMPWAGCREIEVVDLEWEKEHC